MTDLSEQRLARLSAKMALLTERYRRTATDYDREHRRAELLEEAVKGLNAKIADLHRQQEARDQAQALVAGGSQTELTRRRILSFVREIDRCIADINASEI